MTLEKEPGILRVTQLRGIGRKPATVVRDFDNEEWVYFWVENKYFTILRLERRNAPIDSETYEFAEFSAPVSVEFISEG